MDVAADTGTPVNASYDVPFRFTGRIEKVVVSLGGSKPCSAEQAEVRAAQRKARQENE